MQRTNLQPKRFPKKKNKDLTFKPESNQPIIKSVIKPNKVGNSTPVQKSQGDQTALTSTSTKKEHLLHHQSMIYQ